jgi:hypothetical protein
MGSSSGWRMVMDRELFATTKSCKMSVLIGTTEKGFHRPAHTQSFQPIRIVSNSPVIRNDFHYVTAIFPDSSRQCFHAPSLAVSEPFNPLRHPLLRHGVPSGRAPTVDGSLPLCAASRRPRGRIEAASRHTRIAPICVVSALGD